MPCYGELTAIQLGGSSLTIYFVHCALSGSLFALNGSAFFRLLSIIFDVLYYVVSALLLSGVLQPNLLDRLNLDHPQINQIPSTFNYRSVWEQADELDWRGQSARSCAKQITFAGPTKLWNRCCLFPVPARFVIDGPKIWKTLLVLSRNSGFGTDILIWISLPGPRNRNTCISFPG